MAALAAQGSNAAASAVPARPGRRDTGGVARTWWVLRMLPPGLVAALWVQAGRRLSAEAACAMIKVLIQGGAMDEVLNKKGRVRASREELFEAISAEDLSDVHRFVLDEIMQHIEQIEQRVARMDAY